MSSIIGRSISAAGASLVVLTAAASMMRAIEPPVNEDPTIETTMRIGGQQSSYISSCESSKEDANNAKPVKIAEFGSSGVFFQDTLEVVSLADPKVDGVTIHIAHIKRPITDRLRKGILNIFKLFLAMRAIFLLIGAFIESRACM